MRGLLGMMVNSIDGIEIDIWLTVKSKEDWLIVCC